jgi:hypothetical protein
LKKTTKTGKKKPQSTHPDHKVGTLVSLLATGKAKKVVLPEFGSEPRFEPELL